MYIYNDGKSTNIKSSGPLQRPMIMRERKYIIGSASTTLAPSVICAFGMDCLNKIEELERAKPGSLVDPAMTTTASGTAGITVMKSLGWQDAGTTAIAKNLLALTVTLLTDI